MQIRNGPLVLALLLLTSALTTAAAQIPAPPRYVMVIHGGAGTIRRESMMPTTEKAYRDTLTIALRRGYEILARGGTSLDAVEATIRVMEDSPLFNAGKGAVFTSAGTNELDAAIMDGRTLAAGSVAAVQHIKNPISLARLVMEKSPHVMMVGPGAEEFARLQGMELVLPSYFRTERRWNQLQDEKRAADTARKGASVEGENKFGTVGAIALDKTGNLAAATSTGGTSSKRYGRVGDTPIIGAGTYATPACAVSATGAGEFFIRNNVAADICARAKYTGVSIGRAADDVVNKVLVAQKGEGGVIAMDAKGNIAAPFNTSGMYRGWVTADGVIVIKIFRD
jgi:L-asparaginase / beta-aspartyl-peptidase